MLHHLNLALQANLASCVGAITGLLFFCSPLWGQEIKPRLTLIGHKARVMSVAISPDGKLLASGGDDVTLRFWDMASGKELNTIKDAYRGDFINSLVFSPDGKTLASGGGGSAMNMVKLWDLGTRKAVTLQEEGQCMHPMTAFSSDGKTIASAATFLNKTPLKFWDPTTRKLVAKTEDELAVEAMAFTPDCKTAVVLSSLGGITSVQVSSGKIEATTKVDGGSFFSAFSPDAKTLAMAIKENNTIKLVDVATGKQLLSIKEDEETSSIVFSPNGKMLATGGFETIKLWSVATGKEVATLIGHKREVRSLAFTPDGKILASGSSDKTIKIWDVPPQK
jgi:WD40 repeat protein